MNLPNKLTLLRVIMIPVFLVVFMCDLGIDRQVARYIATGIFCLASITDALDGHIARKYNLVTNFGKFMDPLADKLLVSSAMISLIVAEDALVVLPAWIVIVIIAREFAITGFRTLAAEQQVVIAASKWGKAKTISQMIMIILLLLNISNAVLTTVSTVFIALSLALTVVSAIDYMVKNKGVLKE
jgi:CDP-diacylglycerol--glycerol-3-phosphate 3-phosphatidyltransferase